MPRAILVSGPINAGKTTVARLLARRIAGTAHVEGDALRAFVDCLPLEAALAPTLRNLADVSRNLLAADLHVVVDYLLRPADHAGLVEALAPAASAVHSFVLAPPLHVALSNRGRPLDEWERARIRELYDERIHEPGFGITIDTAEQTPEQTVDEILAHVRRSGS